MRCPINAANSRHRYCTTGCRNRCMGGTSAYATVTTVSGKRSASGKHTPTFHFNDAPDMGSLTTPQFFYAVISCFQLIKEIDALERKFMHNRSYFTLRDDSSPRPRPRACHTSKYARAAITKAAPKAPRMASAATNMSTAFRAISVVERLRNTASGYCAADETRRR